MVLQGNFLVVGGKATEAANLFLRSGSSWSSLSTLVAPNPGTTDLFGAAVGAWGETVIVGAVQAASKATGLNGDGADNSSNYSGTAHFFRQGCGATGAGLTAGAASFWTFKTVLNVAKLAESRAGGRWAVGKKRPAGVCRRLRPRPSLPGSPTKLPDEPTVRLKVEMLARSWRSLLRRRP